MDIAFDTRISDSRILLVIVSEVLVCVGSDGSALVVIGVAGSVSFVSSVVEPKVDLRSAAED